MPDFIPENRIQNLLYEERAFGGEEMEAKPEIFIPSYIIRNPHEDNGNFVFEQ